MATTSRRSFLKGTGLALVAAMSPANSLMGTEASVGWIPGVEPFVQTGRTRLVGIRNLIANGWEFTVKDEEYAGGKKYWLGVKNTAGTSRLIDHAGLILPPLPRTGERRWRVFLDSGHSGWCGVKPLEFLDPDKNLQPVREKRSDGGAMVYHQSDMEAVVWDAATGTCLLAGFLRQRHGRNLIHVFPNRTATDIDCIEAVQELHLEIGPGRAQPLDPLVVSLGSDPYVMLETYGEAVAKYHGKSFNDPPIVGMMTWYGYQTEINEQLVLDNAKLIADLFSGYPQKMQLMMLCDHGWQQDANWGYWEADKTRFPHGMKWLADQLENYGMSLGLWYTPFCITENAQNHQELVPLESLDAHGRPSVSRPCVWGQLPGQPNCMDVTFFDGGKPAVQRMWGDTLAKMKEWGTFYWKLDFFDLQTSYNTRKRLGDGDLCAETWKTFRNAVGESGKLNPCSCDTNLQVGYCDSIRIASDIGNAGDWSGTMHGYRHGMGTIAALWYKHRKFWINDPDSIQIAKGCSLAEARVRSTVVAMSGGHLMLSEDLRSVDPERIEIVRRLLPAYPHAARPLDLFEHSFPDGYPALWSLPVQACFGPMTVLAVFNLTSESRKYEITDKMLGINSGQEFLALEWWQYRWLGRFRSKFEIEVPAGDVAVIHAQPVKNVPSLISVSHHYTGSYIIADVEFDPSTGVLKGVLATKRGLRIALFGARPNGWKLSSIAKFHAVENSYGGWQSEVVTKDTRTPFSIRFQKA